MRPTFWTALGLLACLALNDPAVARPGEASMEHLSYYTYYRCREGETVADLAARYGLAESSLLRMNPFLADYPAELPEGTMVCVPQAREEAPSETAGAAPKAAPTPKATAQSSEPKRAKPTATPPASARASERDEPDEAEWEHLASLATKGAPASAPPRAAQPPMSRLIRPNGEVVWIPAAKPKPKPKPKADPARAQLSSRKGKAIHEVILSCRSFMGTPYVWGGQRPGGFDCSGYVQYVFGKHGYRLPRTADIQFEVGEVVARGSERPGDLVFFETYAPGASHVGVYLGRDYFIHASSSRGVTIDRLSSDFFGQRYLGARRNI